MPASQTTLLTYIAFLSRTLQPSSIQNYLNIIRILHLDSGLVNPLKDNYAVSNLKKGISRAKGSPPKQKFPITCKILLDIRKQLCFLLPADIVFWSACLIGFYGFLRKKTLLPMSLACPGDSCILRSDVVMDELFSFTIGIRKTKTIQCGERVLNMPFVACEGSLLCPYQAFCDSLLVALKKEDLPPFLTKNMVK